MLAISNVVVTIAVTLATVAVAVFSKTVPPSKVEIVLKHCKYDDSVPDNMLPPTL